MSQSILAKFDFILIYIRVEHRDVLHGWLVADKFSFGCDIK